MLQLVFEISGEKRKLKALDKSSSDAINFKLSEVFLFLKWPEPYVLERDDFKL